MYLWLDGRWAVPWLTRPAMPAASRLVRVPWTVERGSLQLPANATESVKDIRLRASSSFRSEVAMYRE